MGRQLLREQSTCSLCSKVSQGISVNLIFKENGKAQKPDKFGMVASSELPENGSASSSTQLGAQSWNRAVPAWKSVCQPLAHLKPLLGARKLLQKTQQLWKKQPTNKLKKEKKPQTKKPQINKNTNKATQKSAAKTKKKDHWSLPLNAELMVSLNWK